MKTLVLLLLGFYFNSNARPLPCDSAASLQVGEQCLAQINEFRPTQSAVGVAAALDKQEKLEKHYRKGKLWKKTKDKIIPVIVGPDLALYILDGHHTSWALLNSKLIPLDEKKLTIQVFLNAAHMSMSAFYDEVLAHNAFLLKTDREKPVLPSELPTSLAKLEDDPFRSIAKFVNKNKYSGGKGCYKKVEVNFLEFYWAKHFFNSGLKFQGDYPTATLAALKLCREETAKHLPGYVE